MEILNFEHYCVIESASVLTPTSIDLDDDSTKIEIGEHYVFLGIRFTPMYDNSGLNKESFTAIIQRPGIKSGAETYWGKIVKAVDLIELKKEIRVEIKYYLEENPIVESKISSSVSEFKEFYNNKDYKSAAQIVLAGWGNDKEPLSAKDQEIINKFIKKSSNKMQEDFNDYMAATTGTFR